MAVYHEIRGSRRYEVREPIGGWRDAGAATPDILASIKAGMGAAEYDIREICSVCDDDGLLVGTLTFSRIVYRQKF